MLHQRCVVSMLAPSQPTKSLHVQVKVTGLTLLDNKAIPKAEAKHLHGMQ